MHSLLHNHHIPSVYFLVDDELYQLIKFYGVKWENGYE